MRSKARPLLALGIGVLLSLALLELTLQALALAAGVESRAVAGDPRPAILCVGDSNTYGIFLEPEDSYPGQLQSFLDAAGEDFVVVNQGYPGQNTAQVRAGLEETLRTLAPAAVVVYAGVNDRWSDEDRPAWTGESPGLLSSLLARSRVLKLARILRSSSSAEAATTAPAAAPASEERLPDDRFPAPPEVMRNKASEETRAAIRANLEAIAEACRARGAALVLVGYALYAEDIREDVNATIRASAESHGAQYVDLEARFGELLAKLGKDALYVPRDSHLSAVGNHEAARQVMIALRQAGVIAADPPPTLEEAFAGLALTAEREGDLVRLDLTGPPLWKWKVQLQGLYALPGRGSAVRRVTENLAWTGAGARERAAWEGAFDADGHGTTRVHAPEPSAIESWLGWELLALARGEGARDVRFSASIPLP